MYADTFKIKITCYYNFEKLVSWLKWDSTYAWDSFLEVLNKIYGELKEMKQFQAIYQRTIQFCWCFQASLVERIVFSDEKDSFVKFVRNKTFRVFPLKIEILSHDWSEIQRTPRIHFESICKCYKHEQAFRLFKNRCQLTWLEANNSFVSWANCTLCGCNKCWLFTLCN